MIPLSLAFTLAMLSLNVALYLTPFTAPFYKGTQKLKLPCLKTEDSL